jgi:uncharacterized protein (TIGR02453 family)
MDETMIFTGFPAEGFAFLADLRANNEKVWFEENKQRYIDDVQTPALALVATLGAGLQEHFPNVTYGTQVNGSGSLMRIYRDVRFSKDKTPYKTEITMGFWEGSRKKMLNPSFGLRITPEDTSLMAGVFGLDKEQLAAYRDAVVDDRLGWELVEIIQKVQASGDYTINDKHYKKAPRGYTLPEDERAPYLLYNGLYASLESIAPEIVYSGEFVDVVLEHFVNMSPIQQWLVKVLN